MYGIYAILFLVIGLIVGSFLNVVILRMDDLKSLIYTRSRCPECKKEIPWYDLIPFLSFFILGARCRFCKGKISSQYPLVEAGVGILFALLYLMFGLGWGLIFYLVVFSILTVIFVYDIKTQTVPEPFVWLALVLSLLGGWYFGGFGVLSMLSGALITGAFIGSLAIFSKEKWMGYGDIKIAIILGLLTGYPAAIFGLFFAFILGSIFGVVLMYLKGKNLKTAIAFAPFIIFSALFTITYGQIIINWYLNIF
jgi:leader peptidase (prepilin peptidase)/N-methyltransferase